MLGKYHGCSVGFAGLVVGVGFVSFGVLNGLDWFFGFGPKFVCGGGRDSFALIFPFPCVQVGTFASFFEEENLLSVAGLPLPNAFSSSVAHFRWVSVHAWLLTFSDLGSLGERGARSSIICPLCVWSRTLIDTRRGSILSCCGLVRFNGRKFGLLFPEQHFVYHIVLNFLQSCKAGSPNAPLVSRIKGRQMYSELSMSSYLALLIRSVAAASPPGPVFKRAEWL